MSGFLKFQHVQSKLNRATNYLNFTEEKIVQIKLDGSNGSIWWDYEHDCIACGSRTQELTIGKTLNGFYNWVQALPNAVKVWFKQHHVRVYGEWMIPHSIQYSQDIQSQFVAFETWYEDTDMRSFENQSWKNLGLLSVPTFKYQETLENIFEAFHSGAFNIDDLFLPINGSHEGIVIKSMDSFHTQRYLKVIDKNYRCDLSASKAQRELDKPKFELSESLIQKEYDKFKYELGFKPFDIKMMGALCNQIFTAWIEDELVDYVLTNYPESLNFKELRKSVGSKIMAMEIKPWDVIPGI